MNVDIFKCYRRYWSYYFR